MQSAKGAFTIDRSGGALVLPDDGQAGLFHVLPLSPGLAMENGKPALALNVMRKKIAGESRLLAAFLTATLALKLDEDLKAEVLRKAPVPDGVSARCLTLEMLRCEGELHLDEDQIFSAPASPVPPIRTVINANFMEADLEPVLGAFKSGLRDAEVRFRCTFSLADMSETSRASNMFSFGVTDSGFHSASDSLAVSETRGGEVTLEVSAPLDIGRRGAKDALLEKEI